MLSVELCAALATGFDWHFALSDTQSRAVSRLHNVGYFGDFAWLQQY